MMLIHVWVISVWMIIIGEYWTAAHEERKWKVGNNTWQEVNGGNFTLHYLEKAKGGSFCNLNIKLIQDSRITNWCGDWTREKIILFYSQLCLDMFINYWIKNSTIVLSASITRDVSELSLENMHCLHLYIQTHGIENMILTTQKIGRQQFVLSMWWLLLVIYLVVKLFDMAFHVSIFFVMPS